MLVEVCQEELPVHAHVELWGHHSCQAGWPCVHKLQLAHKLQLVDRLMTKIA